MDPNLFHIDWERTFEALTGITILAFFVERACALLFESRWWIRKFEGEQRDTTSSKPGSAGTLPDAQGKEPADSPDRKTDFKPAAVEAEVLLPGRKYPLKEFVGFLVALIICWAWDFDAISIILLNDQTRLVGVVATAAIVAGGSKASIALFHDVLHIGSNASKERSSG